MMYQLPTVINIGGVDYKIRGEGDYRIVLDTFSILDDIELDKQERILAALCIFYEDFDRLENVLAFPYLSDAIEKMFEFFNAGRPEDKTPSTGKLIDWDNDSAMICSAVNAVAKTEIRSEDYLHWWTFMSYYMSVGESVMSTVISIRDKILKGKHLEKWEREYRRDNPQYFKWNSKSADDRAVEDWLMAAWNNGEAQ